MEGVYGRRGGSSRRHNHGEYQMRGRGSRRGRGGNRRDYADHERASYHDDRDCYESRDTSEGSFRPRGRGGRGGRPPGLRGKEIGMYYARLSKDKAKKKDIDNRATIDIDSHRERNLSNLLADIRAQETIRPQPSRRYRDAFDDDEEEETFKMGSQTEAYGSVPESVRDMVVLDSWEDADDSPNVPTTSKSQSKTPSSSTGASSTGASSTSRGEGSKHGDDMGGYFIDRSGGGVDTNSDSDVELLDGEQMVLGEDVSTEDMTDDIEDAEVSKYTPAITEMYKSYAGESDFFMEFQRHNEANRRSNEKLHDIRGRDFTLPRDERLDAQLLDMMEARRKDNRQYQRMLEFRKKLPSFQMRENILKTVKSSQVVVLSGETGCGKTTQVSQFILDDYIQRGEGSLCRIVCTQPRRISAISVAERVADERGERCGEGNSVGYQIRLEKKMPRKQGSILYCTTGIMLQWLASDPCLAQTTHIILDEIHERDLQSDFLMIILKDVIRKRRDLKVILMSATLNAEMFSQYYGNCPMMNIPGFTYPVKEYLLEDIVEVTQYKHNNPQDFPYRRRIRHGPNRKKLLEEQEEHEAWVRNLPDKYCRQTQEVLQNMDVKEIDLDLVAQLTLHIVHKRPEGAILIFLPGWEQISKMNGLLKDMGLGNERNFRLIPLHSMLPTVNQREVFERPPPGVRKIVIATNIAETSITIDDVVYVIDCGKIKMKNFDPEHNISTLAPEWVSLANARQRRGRAGRVQPGECFHLYTKLQETKLEDYQLPEILRTRLEELCLQIKLLKLGMVIPFIQKAMEPPSLDAIEVSIQMLKDLSAFDDEEDLTPLGYHLAKMPVDPHTGKMLLFAAMFSCLDPVLTVAASLSFKDAFYIPMGKEKEADKRRHDLAEGTVSDHLMLANAYSGWERAESRGTSGQYCYGNFMSQATLRMLRNMRKQFTTLLHEMKFVDSDNPKASLSNKHSNNKKLIKAVITAGLYPNVAKLVKPKRGRADATLMTKTERRVNIHPKSVNANEEAFPSQWFIYHLKMKTARIYLYDCSCITPYPLLFFGGKMRFKRDNNQDCLVMDEWMFFKASQRIAHLVKELRVELDKLLEYKITHPGVTNWDPKDKEGALMRAILDLITTAEH